MLRFAYGVVQGFVYILFVYLKINKYAEAQKEYHAYGYEEKQRKIHFFTSFKYEKLL